MSGKISTEGLGMPVEIAAIDGELRKLWEADEASTNASLMNFLVYTEDPHELTANSKMIQELTREHACRAVLIAMDRKAPKPSVAAWITAHCHLAHGKKSICSEQISFLLSGYSFGRFATPFLRISIATCLSCFGGRVRSPIFSKSGFTVFWIVSFLIAPRGRIRRKVLPKSWKRVSRRMIIW